MDRGDSHDCRSVEALQESLRCVEETEGRLETDLEEDVRRVTRKVQLHTRLVEHILCGDLTVTFHRKGEVILHVELTIGNLLKFFHPTCKLVGTRNLSLTEEFFIVIGRNVSGQPATTRLLNPLDPANHSVTRVGTVRIGKG